MRYDGRMSLGAPPPTHEEIVRQVDQLVKECRAGHLWFRREDYFPRTDPERLAVLDDIQKRANLETFRRAGQLKSWLSRLSSSGSAGS